MSQQCKHTEAALRIPGTCPLSMIKYLFSIKIAFNSQWLSRQRVSVVGRRWPCHATPPGIKCYIGAVDKAMYYVYG